jgi:hypothetical protein
MGSFMLLRVVACEWHVGVVVLSDYISLSLFFCFLSRYHVAQLSSLGTQVQSELHKRLESAPAFNFYGPYGDAWSQVGRALELSSTISCYRSLTLTHAQTYVHFRVPANETRRAVSLFLSLSSYVPFYCPFYISEKCDLKRARTNR